MDSSDSESEHSHHQHSNHNHNHHNDGDEVNPLFLHHAESPSQSLINLKLDARNYHRWSRLMYVALSAKNKLPFIDGTLSRPAINDPNYFKWMRANHMVISWISNCLSPELGDFTLYSDSAVQVWKELKRRFSRSSNNHIYMLEQSLIATKQDNSPISVYYSKLKTLWDEISQYEESAVCTVDNCPVLIEMNRRLERKYVMQFLMGLKECFTSVRNQILLKDPLPPIDNVFNLVLQEEANQELSISIGYQNDSMTMAMAAQSNPNYNRNKTGDKSRYYTYEGSEQHGHKQKICTHCKKTNHTIENCFELIGYPPGHKLARFKSQIGQTSGGWQNTNKNIVNAVMQEEQLEESGKGSISLTQEEYQQFCSLIKGGINLASASNVPHSNPSNVSYPPNNPHLSNQVASNSSFQKSGIQHLESDWDS
ncbi:unnamed protein product [Cuscuta epithymum]|uniref:Retrotransposon Copia-like N-terminal domain-containing protein n=1 Tax=Cuscuta epithymum TaxID=186058 RepID=A0AAV0C291_9ASTE|nr:unnamed protein product [Cuscuta epithymum]CAH9121445.1 unnamed protein product [Cuscuta epithymum]